MAGGTVDIRTTGTVTASGVQATAINIQASGHATLAMEGPLTVRGNYSSAGAVEALAAVSPIPQMARRSQERGSASIYSS